MSKSPTLLSVSADLIGNMTNLLAAKACDQLQSDMHTAVDRIVGGLRKELTGEEAPKAAAPAKRPPRATKHCSPVKGEKIKVGSMTLPPSAKALYDRLPNGGAAVGVREVKKALREIGLKPTNEGPIMSQLVRAGLARRVRRGLFVKQDIDQ